MARMELPELSCAWKCVLLIEVNDQPTACGRRIRVPVLWRFGDPAAANSAGEEDEHEKVMSEQRKPAGRAAC